MVRKPIKEAKSVAKSFSAEKFMKKIGLDLKDQFFLKKVGKGVLGAYTVFTGVWLWSMGTKEGWFTNKEEKELSHFNERRMFVSPGEEEARDVVVSKGGIVRTMTEPKGFGDSDKGSVSYQELRDKEFQEEALKLWLGMRGEVVAEIKEKGIDVA